MRVFTNEELEEIRQKLESNISMLVIQDEYSTTRATIVKQFSKSEWERIKKVRKQARLNSASKITPKLMAVKKALMESPEVPVKDILRDMGVRERFANNFSAKDKEEIKQARKQGNLPGEEYRDVNPVRGHFKG